jgi:hypothetical protein
MMLEGGVPSTNWTRAKPTVAGISWVTPKPEHLQSKSSRDQPDILPFELVQFCIHNGEPEIGDPRSTWIERFGNEVTSSADGFEWFCGALEIESQPPMETPT